MSTCYFMSNGECGQSSNSSMCKCLTNNGGCKTNIINSFRSTNMSNTKIDELIASYQYGTCESEGYCHKTGTYSASGFTLFDQKVACAAPIVNHITNANQININWKDVAHYTEY